MTVTVLPSVRRLRAFFAAGCCLGLGLHAEAQDFQKRVFADPRGGSLPYALFLPPNYDTKQKYPLLLFLHDREQRGDDGKRQTVDLAAWTKPELQAKHPCIVVAPQCPYQYELFQIYGWDKTHDNVDFNDYTDKIKTWKHYKIPVGRYYVGPRKYLALWNFDWGSKNAIECAFRNVKVYEAGQGEKTKPLNFSVHALEPYDKPVQNGTVILEDGGATVHMNGDIREKVALPVNVTPNTYLEFDFNGLHQGSRQGIGLCGDTGFQEGRWVDGDDNPEKREQPKEPSFPMRLVMDMIPALQKELSVDPQRIYLSGVHMGGVGVWDLLARKPEWFAAAVPIAGAADTSTLDRLKTMPIWDFHGREDGTVRTEGSWQAVAGLAEVGGKPRYTEYPKETREVAQKAFAEPDLADWLFAQKRDLTPPPTPTGITVKLIGAHTAELSWPAATDAAAGIREYRVFKNGSARAVVTDPHYTDVTLDESDVSSYTVTAISARGIASPPSAMVWARTPPDTFPPHIVRAQAIGGPTVVEIEFDKPLAEASVADPANYLLSGGITVSSAALAADHRTVILKTTEMMPNGIYTLKIANIKDRASKPNTVAPDTTLHLTYEPTLAAYWRFDEGDGANAFDSSGNGLVAALHDVAWTRGRFGQAVEFDGVWGHGISLRSTPLLDITDALTVSLWVQKTGGQFTHMSLLTKQNFFDKHDQFSLDFDDTQHVRARVDTDGVTAVTVLGERLDTAKWHHIAMTYANNTLELWIDGVSQGKAMGSGPLVSTSEPVVIGAGQQGRDPFKGDIDEVRIYRKALSPDEIRALAQ